MNQTFNINCIRADPQAGICEKGGDSCGGSFSQTFTLIDSSPGIPFINLIAGVVQHIGTSCLLNLTFIVNVQPGSLVPFMTLPVGFFPLGGTISVAVTSAPSSNTDILQIDTLGQLEFLNGFSINVGESVTISVVYPC